MKKLSESIFNAGIERNQGNDDKLEDKLNNIKSLQPIDMGGSVLWANADYISYGEEFFTFEDANNLNIYGWRLPTLKEVSELNTDTILKEKKLGYNLISKNTQETLFFPRKGFVYTSSNLGVIDEDLYYGWTSDVYYNNSIHIFTIDSDKIWCSPVSGADSATAVVQQKSDKLCVRLVRDK